MKHFFFFTLITVIVACQPSNEIPLQKEQLIKTWIFKDIDYGENRFYSPTIKESLLKDKYFLHLFPEDKAVIVSGDDYIIATYKYYGIEQNLEIDLVKSAVLGPALNDNSGIAVLRENMKFENMKLSIEEELLNLTVDIEAVGKITFVAYGNIGDEFESHPFYPGNNSWRFKPAAPETEIEIKQRLHNHITHQKLLYQHTLQDPKYYMSTGHSKGPLQHYKGSIGIKDFTKIPAQWHQTFWSAEEAAQAFGLLRTFLGNKVIRGKTGGDWKETNHKILVELEERMREDVE